MKSRRTPLCGSRARQDHRPLNELGRLIGEDLPPRRRREVLDLWQPLGADPECDVHVASEPWLAVDQDGLTADNHVGHATAFKAARDLFQKALDH